MSTPANHSTSFFKEPKPLSIRLWHWFTFLFFTASITTVIFGSTLFKTKNNISMVQEQVQSKGGSITPDQARKVAHEFSDKLWMLHKYLGYALCFLLLWRIIAEITLSKEKKLLTRIRFAASFPVKGPEQKHNLFVQYGYLIFYFLFLLMGLTGLVLAFEDVSWLDPIHKLSKNIHSYVQYGLYTYTILHMIGVIRADIGSYGGIVSRMINGKSNGN